MVRRRMMAGCVLAIRLCTRLCHPYIPNNFKIVSFQNVQRATTTTTNPYG